MATSTVKEDLAKEGWSNTVIIAKFLQNAAVRRNAPQNIDNFAQVSLKPRGAA